MQLDARGVEVFHVLVFAAPVGAQLHDCADIFRRRQDVDLCERLLRHLDLRRVRIVERRIDVDLRPVELRDLVDDVRRRRDEVEIVLALQPLHDDLHVQQSKEAAPETEAERDGIFLRIAHGGIIQLELFQRVAQIAVLRAVRRIDAGEHHRLCLLVAGKRLRSRVRRVGDGVAHARVGDGLDGGRQIADLACAERLGGPHSERMQIADLHDLIDRTGRHHLNVHTGLHHAVHNAHIDDRAAVGVVLAVEDQALKRRAAVALRGRDVVHHVLQHRVDVDAVFRGDLRRVHRRQADHVLDLVLDLLRPRSREVDLVDDRQHLEVVVDGKIGVRQRLGLNALRGVHDQKRALARGQAPRDLIVEVHMARRVDQIQDVRLAVVGVILQPDGAGLDGDAALALQLHRVEHLILHLALFDRVAFLQQAVRQRGLAVVDVRNDAEITDFR